MKGILFKPWKAEAIRLSGTDREWQTRRALKPQPSPDAAALSVWGSKPKYNMGETVYVKERYRYVFGTPANGSDQGVEYATGDIVWHHDNPTRGHISYPFGTKWRTTMFMPAIAARTLLLITGVRVERTRDISEEDCIAEGVVQSPQWGQMQDFTGPGHEGYLSPEEAEKDLDKCWEAYVREAFWKLYDSINGAGAHKLNWDWVYAFRRVEPDHIVDLNNMVGDKPCDIALPRPHMVPIVSGDDRGGDR